MHSQLISPIHHLKTQVAKIKQAPSIFENFHLQKGPFKFLVLFEKIFLNFKYYNFAIGEVFQSKILRGHS